MKKQTRKLLKGIVLFTLFYTLNHFIGGADGLNQIEKHICGSLQFLHEALAKFIATIIVLIISISMIYCFVSGLFRIFTHNIYIKEFEGKKQ